MVVSYLEKLQDEYTQKMYVLGQECERLQLRMRENTELIKMLEDVTDPNYESFTPRVVNTKNKIKIQELQEQQKEIQRTYEQQKNVYTEYEGKLAELSGVIDMERKMLDELQRKRIELEECRTALFEIQQAENQQRLSALFDSILQNMTSLLHKIDFCTKVAEVDNIRCKLELNGIYKLMYDMINDLQNTQSSQQQE